MSKSTAKEFAKRLQEIQKLGGLNDDNYSRFFTPLSLTMYLLSGNISLMKGEGDLCSLGVYLAALSLWPQKTFYIHGSLIPENDRILKLITQLQPQSMVDITAKYSQNFQRFPLNLETTGWRHGFQWQVIDQNYTWMILDSAAPKKPSLLEKCFPDGSLIFLSGFDFSIMPERQCAVLKHLKKRGCAVVLIDDTGTCNLNSTLFDRIFTCSLRRKNHCCKRKLSIKVQDQSCRNYPIVKVDSPDDRIFWIEKEDKYEILQTLVAECTRQGLTASETVAYLNNHKGCTMTLPTLARLKRKWGIRSYREEKRPRKKRTQTDASVSKQM